MARFVRTRWNFQRARGAPSIWIRANGIVRHPSGLSHSQVQVGGATPRNRTWYQTCRVLAGLRHFGDLDLKGRRPPEAASELHLCGFHRTLLSKKSDARKHSGGHHCSHWQSLDLASRVWDAPIFFIETTTSPSSNRTTMWVATPTPCS